MFGVVIWEGEMKRTHVAMAFAAAVGAILATSVSAAPVPPGGLETPQGGIVQVQMTRSERMMMRRQMMRKKMMRQRMMKRRMMMNRM